MATYIPNATQTTEPVESRTVESAALEFRTLKTSINARIEDVQTQNNAQDVRLQAIEAALLAIGEGGLPGTVYVQRLSGTGAQTAFTLNVSVPTSALIDVFINGIYQNKDTFTISGTSLTFSEAPPAGTDNIEVVVSITIANVETDASLVSFRATDSTAVVRTAQDKLREGVSVKDFGAKGDGVTDDTLAVQAMIGAHGFARFTVGNYRVTTATFDAPLNFEHGAYLTAAATETVKITSRIESPRQWIFKGDGAYLINIDSNSGEDARDIHVSWFGAIPTNTTNVDLKPYIQKAFDALAGQVREGIVRFDQGSYHVTPGLYPARGTHVKGSGTRRTVFDVSGAGDVFIADHDATRFTDIMFEQPSGSVSYQTGALIVLNGARCEVENCWFWNREYGIVVNGGEASIRNISGTYGQTIPANTALVLIKGNGANVDGVKIQNTGTGPAAVVEIGRGATASISMIRVSDVQVTPPCIPVLITADTNNVSRVSVSDLMFGGSGANTIDALVKIVTSGSTSVSNITMSGLNANANALSLLAVEQGSSGITENLVIDTSTITGATGKGIDLVRTAGTLRDIRVGDTVEMAGRDTPISRSGTMSNVRVSPLATPNANAAYCYNFTVPDDSVAVIDLGRSVFTGVGLLTCGSVAYGVYLVRAAPSPDLVAMTTPSSNVATATTALTGTTGADGKLTIGVQDKTIYLENRLGSSQAIHFTVLTGN